MDGAGEAGEAAGTAGTGETPGAAGATLAEPAHGCYRPRGLARLLLALGRATPLGRGRARRRLGRLFRSLHPGPVDTWLWGAPVRLHPASNVGERKVLVSPGRFNRAELRAVSGRLRGPGAVFVDIGANAGLFSLWAALKAAPGTLVLAVEPNPELFARMAFNLRGAGGRVELRLRQLALGAAAGEAVLQADPRTLGTGRIVEAGAAGTAVAMRRLDQVLAEEGIGRIDVLKIDVEGYEDQVLRPFFEAAPRALWPRAVVIEHIERGGWRWDCIAELEARGYAARPLSRNNTLLSLG